MTRPNYYKASIPLGPEEIAAGKPGERMSAVIQPFHVIPALGMDFFAGNALKYLWRLGRKGLSKEERLADARKARTYVDEVIADLERESEP